MKNQRILLPPFQPQPEHSTLNPKPSTVFSDYARYYDLLYRDKDYAAEAECGSNSKQDKNFRCVERPPVRPR